MKMVWFILLMAAVAAVPARAMNVRHVVWRKTPIAVSLPIGSEKIIDFPGRVTPLLPADLVGGGSLRSINNDGTLYLTATRAFANRLAEVRLHNARGDVVLLRLTASKTGGRGRVAVVLPNPARSVANPAHDAPRSLGTLVSWVARRLYAPKRLLTRPEWIARVPMHTRRFVALYRGAEVSAMPLASWRSRDRFVTAVLLRNIGRRRIRLRHGMVRGDWMALAFFRPGRAPSVLTRSGTETDSATAILVSSAPFRLALRGGGLR